MASTPAPCHVAVDADGGGDPQPPGGVRVGPVERGAQRALAAEDAHQAAVRADGGGDLAVRGVQDGEGFLGVLRRVEEQQVAGHDLAQLGEAVHAGEVGLGDDADRPLVGDHDARAVGPLGQQRQGVAHGLGGRQHDRGVQHQVASLDPGDDVGDHVERNVLRYDGQPAAAGHRLGHPAAGDRGHVGDHDGNGGAGAVRAGEVDAVPGADGRPVGDHEDVVVGQVVGRRRVVQELHARSHLLQRYSVGGELRLLCTVSPIRVRSGGPVSAAAPAGIVGWPTKAG
jgi:hypothetical protein